MLTKVTRESLEKIQHCLNSHDAVILELLNQNVKLDELLNLRTEDIDITTNTIFLNQKESSRTIQISKYCMELIQESLNSPFYKKTNGETIVLEDNGYLIRSLNNPQRKPTKKELKERIISIFSSFSRELYSAS